MRRTIGVLCGMSLLATATALGAVGAGVGEMHPDFVLPAIDDRRPVRLSDFRGQKVLLVQFASW